MTEAALRHRMMREQSREAILTAALGLFGEGSFAETTTAAIAERAGVSKGLIFNYFPSKDALLQALVERMMSEALDFWDAQLWTGPAEEQLGRWIDEAIGQVRRSPGFYRLYFSLTLQPGGSAAVERALAKLKPRLDKYLERARRLLAEVGSPDPALDATLLQCAINGVAQIIVTGPNFIEEAGLVSPDLLRARMLEIFLPTGGTGDRR